MNTPKLISALVETAATVALLDAALVTPCTLTFFAHEVPHASEAVRQWAVEHGFAIRSDFELGYVVLHVDAAGSAIAVHCDAQQEAA